MSNALASSSSSTPRHLYRSLLRELRSNPNAPPTKPIVLAPAFRSQPIVEYVRGTFRSSAEARQEKAEEERRRIMMREMRDLETYLRSNRVHRELLARYSPLHDLTEQERVKATARRVGLDVPQLYDPEAEADAEGKASSAKKAIDQKAQTLGRTGGTGPLPPPDLD